MLTQTKSGLFVLLVIAAFFMISLVIGAFSSQTLALSGVEPLDNSRAEESVNSMAQEATTAQPAMAKTLRKASLNWADYAESAPGPIVRQLWMGETIRQASLNWADYAEMTGPESGSSEHILNPVDATGPF